MKQRLLLISAILLISGCAEKKIEVPVIVPPLKQKCLFPKLPTYNTPTKKNMTSPTHLEGDKYVILGSELKDCLIVNAKLRKICDRYAYVNKKVNEQYQK